MSISHTALDLLVPTPHRLLRAPGEWILNPGEALRVEPGVGRDSSAFELLGRVLAPRAVLRAEAGAAAHLRLRIRGPAAGDGGQGDQGYRLRVASDGIEIDAATPQGLFYGACTLAQLLGAAPIPEGRLRVPGLEIEDRPAFRRRGVMLDVSRDRVPRMTSLFALIERFARWKLNEVQLYMEHTFAYPGHDRVWAHASPFTPTEIRDLARFCADRHIDLVPNQQSLGHFHRWLVHDEYRPLAECPEGVVHPFSREPEPFSLAPTAPATLEFVRGLHGQLLSKFNSKFLNVGLDETFDIGLGASAAEVQARGKGAVYLDYLRDLHRSLAQRGVRMQFWGDVILEHPELVADLPRDAVALEWGYEADHPFAEHAKQFAAAGLDFYVCPGTSSWQSLSGRLANAEENLANAAKAGLAAGACGYLITDWGDFGHWQPQPVSYGPFLVGAGRAWNPSASTPQVERLLDQHVFGSASGSESRFGSPGAPGSPGSLWAALGNLYRESGAHATNGSPLFFLLRFAHEDWPHPRIEGLTRGGLERTRERIEGLRADALHVRMACGDAQLVRDEARWLCTALDFACELGVARMDLGAGTSLDQLGSAVRKHLRSRWSVVCETLRPIWLARSRPGGLADSIHRFDALTQAFEAH